MKKSTIKIVVSIVLLLITMLICVFSIAIGVSSHDIEMAERLSALFHAKISIIVFFTFMIIIWMPWDKFKK